MPQINLVWNDSDNRTQTYQLSLLATEIKSAKIGRDQQKCELWLQHNTVSRVHAEMSFKSDWRRFYLQNLALNNPIRVDGGLLTQGEVALYPGSVIQLGQVLLQVSDVVIDEIAPPAHQPQVFPSQPSATTPHSDDLASTMPTSGQVFPAQGAPVQPAPVQASQGVHSVAPQLVCPKCKSRLLLSLRNSNCPTCGHFLADAASQYFF